MKEWTNLEIENYGFKGFIDVHTLRKNFTIIPTERGVYLVLRFEGPCNFLEKGTGGHFKKRDPNCDVALLSALWIENCSVVYIGQAGGIRNGKWSNSNLRERLKKYLDFGQGKPVGHWGGRLIWQVADNEKLTICWKELPNKIKDPCVEESELIEKFKIVFGRRPFANLRD